MVGMKDGTRARVPGTDELFMPPRAGEGVAAASFAMQRPYRFGKTHAMNEKLFRSPEIPVPDDKREWRVARLERGAVKSYTIEEWRAMHKQSSFPEESK